MKRVVLFLITLFIFLIPVKADLTKEQEEELVGIYTNIIRKYLKSDCSSDGEGC